MSDDEYLPSFDEMKQDAEEEKEEDAAAEQQEKEADRLAEREQDDDEEEEDSRPWCQYGSGCYRTNPSHLAQYRHPRSSTAAAHTPSAQHAAFHAH